MLFYWISLVITLVLVGLTIWLLVRTLNNDCISNKKLNESCSSTVECNGGLICSNGTCKASFGQTCDNTSQCASGLNCMNSICTTILGKVKEECPCDTGHTCINNVCKVIVGGACTNDSDCASNICENGICLVDPETLVPADNDSYDCYDDDICYSTDYTDSSKKSMYSCYDTNCSKTKYYHETTSDTRGYDDYSETSYLSNYTNSDRRDYGNSCSDKSKDSCSRDSSSKDKSSSCSSFTIDMSETD